MDGGASVVVDSIGPEAVLFVTDPDCGMRGVLVIDSTALGPAGGGIRMLPDLTVGEVAQLARAMTYKYGILGLPRGGCKAGIWAKAGMSPSLRQQYVQSFGRLIGPFLKSQTVTVGPDMGLGVIDVAAIYEAAGANYPRSGLYSQSVDGLPFEFHITGHGVYCAARAAFEVAGRPFAGASVAVEGFGHVGVGVAMYSVKNGAKLVAVSTIEGAVVREQGLDLEHLLVLREKHGDRCVLEYADGDRIPNTELYFLDVDLLVPGARPNVITSDNVEKVRAKVISSGGNIPISEQAEDRLFARGILSVPDFIANAGGVISSWVDYLGGGVEQAFKANENLIGRITKEVLTEALRSNTTPRRVATKTVDSRIALVRGKPRKSFDEIKQEIRGLLGVF
jgi:glutamate dehydrogenase (NAD(P)+)